MSYLKVFLLFYRFIKEVILGKATLAQAYVYDRRRVWLLFLILFSLSLNVVTIPALVRSVDATISLREELALVQRIPKDEDQDEIELVPE